MRKGRRKDKRAHRQRRGFVRKGTQLVKNFVKDEDQENQREYVRKLFEMQKGNTEVCVWWRRGCVLVAFVDDVHVASIPQVTFFWNSDLEQEWSWNKSGIVPEVLEVLEEAVR